MSDRTKPDKHPESKKIKIKPEFEEHYKKLLKENYNKFIDYSFSYLRRCIRINTLKIDLETAKKRLKNKLKLYPIPWCKEGFWVEDKNKERYDFGNMLEHQLGYFYLQEAASMIPAIVLDVKENMKVLDMCAAPGSKTSQIAQYMNNTGILIANDMSSMRLKALGSNLQKLGVLNSIITNLNGTQFPENNFDRILVDAPCSGTGTIRKSFKVLQMWSPNLIRKFSKIQKKLITKAFELLTPGGILVYSTCTQEPEENEAIITWFLSQTPNAKLEEINLDINRSAPIKEWKDKKFHKDIKKCLRIYPQDNDSEGFFVAKIRKN
jgi:NOL1/NOP2/sun family putative RNA methylase